MSSLLKYRFFTIVLLLIWEPELHAVSPAPQRFLTICTTISFKIKDRLNQRLEEIDKKKAEHSTTLEMQRYVANSKAYAYQLSLTPKNQSEQKLEFVVPHSTEAALKGYMQSVAKNTVSFGFTKGWFADEAGRPGFHAFVRVGDRMFHYMSKRVDGKEIGYLVEESYSDVQRGLLVRADKPMTFETVFTIPESAKNDLLRYYQDRMANKATIKGTTVIPGYAVDGWGERNPDGTINENCITFALSFTQSHWANDYPGLAKIAKHGGLAISPDSRDAITPNVVTEAVIGSKPLGIVVWGQDAQTTGIVPGQHHWDMLTQLRAIRRYRLNESNTIVLPSSFMR